MRKKSRYRPLKAGDILLIIIFLSFLFFIPHKKGKNLRVKVKNKRVFLYPLNIDRELKFHGSIGTTRVIIKNGAAKIQKAPCPLKLCEKRGWISNQGEQIICIPNKIMLEIEGSNIDGITE